MGRAPCCDKANVRRGPWSPEEDTTLKNYVERYGTGGNWIALPQKAGLKRCGKSCRLRWLNYLRPDIKHGGFTSEEDNVICTLYRNIGSRWSVIASHLQGRTDNDVKNYWNTKLKKKVMAGQTNLTSNANTTTTITTKASPASPPPPPALTPPIKTKTFGYDNNFPTQIDSSSFKLPPFIDQLTPMNFSGSTNIPGTSSSLPMEDNYGYIPWPYITGTTPAAIAGGDDGFIADIDVDSSNELLNWYGGSSLPTISANLWNSGVETKPPNGFSQSLTYM